jgi:hypothetical protein
MAKKSKNIFLNSNFFLGLAVGIVLFSLGLLVYFKLQPVSKETVPENISVTKCYSSSCYSCVDTCNNTYTECMKQQYCDLRPPCKNGCMLTRGGCIQRCIDAQPDSIKSCGRSCDEESNQCNFWCTDDYGNVDPRCANDCQNKHDSCVVNCSK